KPQLDQFLSELGQDYYVSASAACDALDHRSMFNVIDLQFGWKIDLIVRKQRAFSIEEFRRRQTRDWKGKSIPFASPEDIILAKLEWDKITPSERQRSDAAGVSATLGSELDVAYLRKWANALGISDSLEQILRETQDVSE